MNYVSHHQLYMIFLGFIFLFNNSDAISQSKLPYEKDDFVITDIKIQTEFEKYQMNVTVFFKQSPGFFLAFPAIPVVLNENGDTLAIGYNEVYSHNGQDTLIYHLTLLENKIPTYRTCRFILTGYDDWSQSDGNLFGYELKYNGHPSKPLAQIPFDPKKLTIVEIRQGDWEGRFPEVLLSVAANFSSNEVMVMPRLNFIVDEKGDTINYNGVVFPRYGVHRGKTIIIYRAYLKNKVLPDWSNCAYIFHTMSPSKENKQDGLVKYRKQVKVMVHRQPTVKKSNH